MGALDWLIAEDQAMKQYLQGMTVADPGDPARPVPVWFRMPEQEARQRSYPYVAIDLIDVVEAHERTQVGNMKLSQLTYDPPGTIPTQIQGRTRVIDRPVPVDLHYQITTVTRDPRHERQLQAWLWRKFPGKWGALPIPNDNTVRTAQLLGRSYASDMDEYGKRTWRTNYTISVASELWPTVIKQIQNVTDIDFTIEFSGDPSVVVSVFECDSE